VRDGIATPGMGNASGLRGSTPSLASKRRMLGL
jgi:hypothetical protein